MGKKSKATKAKAKAGAASGAPSTSGTGSGNSVGAGAMVISTSKRQNCVRCFGIVRPDKGSACPGCSQLYCWRCEKKAFEECPNGSECVCPLRRCKVCAEGSTAVRVLEEKEGVKFWRGFQKISADAFERFQQHIEQDDALSLHSNSFLQCYDCKAMECQCCSHDPVLRRLLSCGSCRAFRCGPCARERLDKAYDRSLHSIAQHDGLVIGTPQFSEVAGIVSKLVRKTAAGGLLSCSICSACVCVSCMDDRSLKSLVEGMLSSLVRAVEFSEAYRVYRCSHCYWSAKPCTNPTCPNEVGVPTKRCGGCHIDRYCSVDCQLAAYPAHIRRCSKIQMKRVVIGVATRGRLDKALEMIDGFLAQGTAPSADEMYFLCKCVVEAKAIHDANYERIVDKYVRPRLSAETMREIEEENQQQFRMWLQQRGDGADDVDFAGDAGDANRWQRLSSRLQELVDRVATADAQVEKEGQDGN